MAGRAPTPRSSAGAVPARRSRFAIVAARFHEPISKKLVDGALGAFRRGGVPAGDVEVHWVPGSFELPQAAMTLARTGRYDALATLGVVIRGETPHFEHVAREAATGAREVALATGVPVAFGVITALTEEQAWDRAGGGVGNRGEEAAHAALEMAEWRRAVQGPAGRTRGRRARSAARG
jgi:6,7-dimethyl-8-ribityllumazine synthase